MSKIIRVTKHINVNTSSIVRLPEDQLVYKALPPHPSNLPVSVDLRYRMPPVYDQGHLGSCTANAICAAIGFDLPGFVGSRLFVYYNERLIEGTTNSDSGALIHDGVKSLSTWGICTEEMWPYDVNRLSVKPPENCYQAALAHHNPKSVNIKNTLEDMKGCLSNGFPFVVGIMIYSSFETNKVAATGIVPMPGSKDTLLGGHAVLVCGYDDRRQVWIVRNSWGTRWGDRGYFYLPYNYLLNPTLASDLWSIDFI
jgi:C1A family cysteine protease